MGKKVIEKVQDTKREDSPSKFWELSKDPQIRVENTQQMLKNTSVIPDRRPQVISKSTASMIHKQRKPRIYNPDDRFSNGHIKSWKVWKPNSVYKKMAQFLSNIPGLPDKTSIQCKSFDQRMKDQNFVSAPSSSKMDLFQSAITYLKQVTLTPCEKEIIKNYLKKMKEHSSYIKLLESEVQMQDEVSQQQQCQEMKKESDQFIPYQKKEQTSMDLQNNEDRQLIFNQFLDMQK